MDSAAARFLLSFLVLLLSPAISSTNPTTGCYWTESCESKWLGGCGEGHAVTEQSGHCNGLCRGSPPCLPFHTHYYCCKPEIPKVTNRCVICKNKLDFGDEYVCCSDCSEPYLIEKTSKLGYCNTGAELSVQLKPQEIFNWVTGSWMKCSSPCDGGIRYRDVGCFGSIDDFSIKHYPVDDNRCPADEMPARQESCNMNSCVDLSKGSTNDNSQSRMSTWFLILLVLLGLVALGGVGFAGYTFHMRRTSSPSGFVYIMMEGYS